MSQQFMLAKAIKICAAEFESVLDKGGEPYFFHCLQVMKYVKSKDYELRQIAILHDLIEDTDWNEDQLRETGFSERVIKGVLAMTHRSDMSEEDYMKQVSSSVDAIRVKLADLRHNMDCRRLKGVRPKDKERMAKYMDRTIFLRNILAEMNVEFEY
eukprot:TRINITY_DN773396_c0_g1_i1.p1 TRINITY_DN773396_c0_g1~~TRINITY_DN773396_c0_g1_i1.p1  ORF type:complete len:156 (-),score=30.20 TRINITY_DN773396_c0_g1_i1:114-581(-)